MPNRSSNSKPAEVPHQTDPAGAHGIPPLARRREGGLSGFVRPEAGHFPPLRGPIHEHGTDAGGLKTSDICHRKARAQASLARTFLRQTPQPAAAASVPFVIPSGLALEWSPLLNHLLLTWGYKRGYKGERKRPPSELRGQKHVIPLGPWESDGYRRKCHCRPLR